MSELVKNVEESDNRFLERLGSLRCTNSTDFNLKGEYYSTEFQYVKITI